ncbi:MAG: hypothetical protein ACJ72H_03825 [Candidatus Sulfotelmatobacter sp.]
MSAGTDAERHTFWIHEDILHEQPVLQTAPALKDTQGGPAYTVLPSERCWTTGGL